MMKNLTHPQVIALKYMYLLKAVHTYLVLNRNIEQMSAYPYSETCACENGDHPTFCLLIPLTHINIPV